MQGQFRKKERTLAQQVPAAKDFCSCCLQYCRSFRGVALKHEYETGNGKHSPLTHRPRGCKASLPDSYRPRRALASSSLVPRRSLVPTRRRALLRVGTSERLGTRLSEQSGNETRVRPTARSPRTVRLGFGLV